MHRVPSKETPILQKEVLANGNGNSCEPTKTRNIYGTRDLDSVTHNTAYINLKTEKKAHSF